MVVLAAHATKDCCCSVYGEGVGYVSVVMFDCCIANCETYVFLACLCIIALDVA